MTAAELEEVCNGERMACHSHSRWNFWGPQLKLSDATLQGALRCVNEMKALLQTPPKLTQMLTKVRALPYGLLEGFGPLQLVFSPPRDSNTPKLTEVLTQIRGLGYGFFEGFGPSQLVFAPPRDSNTHACMGRVKGAGELLYHLKTERAGVWYKTHRAS
jgi:hypothetical protein